MFAGALLAPIAITAAQDSEKLEKLLSAFTAAEQTSIRNACAGAAAAGPKIFDACIRTKVDELKQSAGPPNLSTLAPGLQDSIRNACRDASLEGPGRYYDCLQQKAVELRQSPGRPDISTFSSDDQDAMRSACRAAESAGPARYYACLRTQIAELRRAPARPDLSAFSAADQAAMRDACAAAGAAGAANFYACLRTQAAERRSASSVAPRPGAAPRNSIQSRRPPGPRAAVPPSRDASTPNAAPPAVVVEPSLREYSSRPWLWIAGLLILVAWPAARFFSKTSAADASGWQAQKTSSAHSHEDARERPRSEEPSSSAEPRPPAFDPYAVLGVPPDATLDQIKTAYRALIVQYHPDKVAQLGPELRQLAAEKSRQINDAYRMLERKVR
jgi:hypothetical protein